MLSGRDVGPVSLSGHSPIAAIFNLTAVRGADEETLRAMSVINPSAFAMLLRHKDSVKKYRKQLEQRWLLKGYSRASCSS